MKEILKETAVVHLPSFREGGERIAAHLGAERFEYRHGIFASLFPRYRRIVAVMSLGIVVRQLAPVLQDKWRDPAVVAVSPDMRYAIPVIGGHHGANRLARELSGLGLIPVVTTATEALQRDSVEAIAERTGTEVINRSTTKAVNASMLGGGAGICRVRGPAIVIADERVSFLCRRGEFTIGIGCRRGITPEEVARAVHCALGSAGIGRNQVSLYATTERKVQETGLRKGIEMLDGILMYLGDDAIGAVRQTGPSAAERIGLKGVAEPCALAVSREGVLVRPKEAYGRVTIAIAR